MKNYDIPVYRVALVKERGITLSEDRMTDSEAVYKLVRSYLDGVDREHLVVVLLDNKNAIIGINTVSIGSLTGSMAHPREVFKPAILVNAASVVLAHNHPSVDPTPSPEDDKTHTRMTQAGEILCIKVLDHLILGDNRYYSYHSRGVTTL